MQKATLSPLVAVRTTPRTTPLQHLSLVHQEEEGWKAKLATQSREQDFPVSRRPLPSGAAQPWLVACLPVGRTEWPATRTAGTRPEPGAVPFCHHLSEDGASMEDERRDRKGLGPVSVSRSAGLCHLQLKGLYLRKKVRYAAQGQSIHILSTSHESGTVLRVFFTKLWEIVIGKAGVSHSDSRASSFHSVSCLENSRSHSRFLEREGA
ncbi:uncharacterized protein LOC125152221 [Prionailurus viverrinus]|uniref:uncharacterized protein LOC125152221 n=1 Tax=Prionailurus viverrinus TaxID=61388 RepID=UPI001FF114E6|nr:uncharacterized protein LOC125152221 [Prionailurus viverrinus]